jgi:hypothetical protein
MNTTIRGRKGEDLAAESYQKQGFTILKRNYRFARAEVNIIAQKGDTLAIVEVKWRSNTYFGDPQSFCFQKTTTIPHHGSGSLCQLQLIRRSSQVLYCNYCGKTTQN